MIDWKHRFLIEYYELEIKILKLRNFIQKYENEKEKLTFTPKCRIELYKKQLKAMEAYLDVLKERAYIEEIEVER